MAVIRLISRTVQHYQAQATEIPLTEAPKHIHFAAVAEDMSGKEPVPAEHEAFNECEEEEYHDCEQQRWPVKQQQLHKQ